MSAAPKLDTGYDLLAQLSTLTDADVRDLGPHGLDALRTVFDSDLYTFAWVVGRCDIMDPQLHGQLCQYIQLWGTPGYERLITQLPRDHLKSTVGTVINALWQISREPHLPVAIFNETEDNTKKWLGAIKSYIEGSLIYQAVYRHLLPPGVAIGDARSTPRTVKWSDSEIDLEGRRLGETEHSISGWGIGSAATGHHWPKIIIDDPIGQKHADSETEMQAARNWVDNHVYLMRPSSQGHVYVNCTPWTYNDTAVQFTQKFGYKLYRRAALEDQSGDPDPYGQPIYPSRFTRELLVAEYETDPYKFWAQRMCRPKAGRDVSFRAEWVRTGSVVTDEHGEPWYHFHGPSRIVDGLPIPNLVRLSEMSKAMYLDPAASDPAKAVKLRHARHGLVTQAVDEYGRRAVLEAWADRVDPRSLIDHVFATARRWSVSTVYVEEVSFSNIYRFWFLDLQRTGQDYAGQYLAPVPVTTGGRDKEERILSLIPGFRRGDYYLNTVGTTKLAVELTEYPHADTKDLVDALSYGEKHTGPPGAESRARDDEWSGGGGQDRDPLTGY